MEHVGRRLRVYYDGDDPPAWKHGEVERWNAEDRHLIKFDNGDPKEWINVDEDEKAGFLEWLSATSEDNNACWAPSPSLTAGRAARKTATMHKHFSKIYQT